MDTGRPPPESRCEMKNLISKLVRVKSRLFAKLKFVRFVLDLDELSFLDSLFVDEIISFLMMEFFQAVLKV